MNVIFDTNSIYYLDTTNSNSSQHLSDNEYENLKDNVENGNLSVFISYISMIELLSHLKEQPKDFTTIQNGVRNLLELKPVFLPDPETVFTEYITNIKTNSTHKSITDSQKVFTAIELASDIQQLESKVDLTTIKNYRDNYENQYTDDIKNFVLSAIPNFDAKRLKGKNTRLSKAELNNFSNYLNSNSWSNWMKYMLAYRGQAKLNGEDASPLDKIDFFEKSYKKLLIHTFQQGYQPQNNKNDYNDLHFNVYFNNSNDYVFITSENNVVFDELKNSNRCMNLKELCNKLNNNNFKNNIQ
jgi:hypothetical protein